MEEDKGVILKYLCDKLKRLNTASGEKVLRKEMWSGIHFGELERCSGGDLETNQVKGKEV